MISGNITAKAEGKTFTLSEGGYLYCPPGSLMTFVNAHAEDSQIFLYKRRYVPVEGHAPWLVSGNACELECIHYEGMDDVILLDFLPKELGFDMNMHILSFAARCQPRLYRNSRPGTRCLYSFRSGGL